jgi:hypothetical protein
VRTGSLVRKVTTHGSAIIDTASDMASSPADSGELAATKRIREQPSLAPTAILRRLNPIHNFRKGQSLERGNRVVEIDEQGNAQSYNSSLFRALIVTCWKRLLLCICLAAFGSILATTSSIVTKRLIAFISRSHAWTNAEGNERNCLQRPGSLRDGFGLAIGLALMRESISILDNHSFFQSMTCGKFQV